MKTDWGGGGGGESLEWEAEKSKMQSDAQLFFFFFCEWKERRGSALSRTGANLACWGRRATGRSGPWPWAANSWTGRSLTLGDRQTRRRQISQCLVRVMSTLSRARHPSLLQTGRRETSRSGYRRVRAGEPPRWSPRTPTSLLSPWPSSRARRRDSLSVRSVISSASALHIIGRSSLRGKTQSATTCLWMTALSKCPGNLGILEKGIIGPWIPCRPICLKTGVSFGGGNASRGNISVWARWRTPGRRSAVWCQSSRCSVRTVWVLIYTTTWTEGVVWAPSVSHLWTASYLRSPRSSPRISPLVLHLNISIRVAAPPSHLWLPAPRSCLLCRCTEWFPATIMSLTCPVSRLGS